MVSDVQPPGHHAPLEPTPRPLNRLDLGALRREQLGQLVRGEVGVDHLAEPRHRDLHALTSVQCPGSRQDPTANCSRKRTSPSKNNLMSGTAYRSNATRSMPMPKAKPVYRSG